MASMAAMPSVVPGDAGSAARPANDRRTEKREAAQLRQRRATERKPLADRQAAIERDLDRLTSERTALDAWLATSDAYAEANKDKLVAAIARQGELTWTLARLEADWLDVEEALGQLAADAAAGNP
jgi:ATP-binding cassette subfamily F protein 3